MKYCLQNKVTEKFKRPFKKRHSSVYHQPSNRVNKYLAQAIDARSVDREKSTHVSLATLCFKDHEKETQVGAFYSVSAHAHTKNLSAVFTEVWYTQICAGTLFLKNLSDAKLRVLRMFLSHT
jgi:hypothetical protein